MKTIKYEYKTFKRNSDYADEIDEKINEYIKKGWILESFESTATDCYVYLIYLLKRQI